MDIRESTKGGKVRYAAYTDGLRVTQWLASREDASRHFVGGLREGRVPPNGYHEQLRDQLHEELDALGFSFNVRLLEEVGDSKADMLAVAIYDMANAGLPDSTIAHFAQVATCTPDVDAAWALC